MVTSVVSQSSAEDGGFEADPPYRKSALRGLKTGRPCCMTAKNAEKNIAHRISSDDNQIDETRYDFDIRQRQIVKTGYLIALVIFLAAHAIRFVYEILKKTGRVNPRSTPLFLFILLVMLLLWASWFYMCPQDPQHLELPLAVHWFGLAILIVGLVLAVGALIQLRGVENIDHLVTTGLFARIRHPMYLGFILWIFGWVMFHGAAVSLVAGLLGIANIIYWQRLEEAHLERTYGNEYLTYRRQTWL